MSGTSSMMTMHPCLLSRLCANAFMVHSLGRRKILDWEEDTTEHKTVKLLGQRFRQGRVQRAAGLLTAAGCSGSERRPANPVGAAISGPNDSVATTAVRPPVTLSKAGTLNSSCFLHACCPTTGHPRPRSRACHAGTKVPRPTALSGLTEGPFSSVRICKLSIHSGKWKTRSILDSRSSSR